MTFCAKQTSRRNGRNCCAISTGCRMCVSSIGGPIGWCARTRPETSRLCSVTLISGCHRVPGKPRLRRLHHRHRPTNAAVAQSVVPRRLEFRRNSHEIRDLQKLTVQVGSKLVNVTLWIVIGRNSGSVDIPRCPSRVLMLWSGKSRTGSGDARRRERTVSRSSWLPRRSAIKNSSAPCSLALVIAPSRLARTSLER